MTLAQVDQTLDRGDDSSPRGCGRSQKPGPDRVKQNLNITNINSNYQKNI